MPVLFKKYIREVRQQRSSLKFLFVRLKRLMAVFMTPIPGTGGLLLTTIARKAWQMLLVWPVP